MWHYLCHEFNVGNTVKRTERLHALSETLRRNGSRGCSAERLADEFGVSVRTVKRDLAALEHSGAPIWSRPGPGGGYGMSASASLPPVSLSPAQAVALMAAIAAAHDAPYADLAAAGVRKIMDVLDPNTRAKANELASRVWVNSSPSSPRTIKSALEEAMVEQQVLRIRYTSADGNTTTRDVEPILFASRNGQWHLVGWCQLRDAVRWFAVSRIERANVTKTACVGHTIDEVGEPPTTAKPVHGQALSKPSP